MEELQKVLVPPQVSVIRPKENSVGWECVKGTQLEARTQLNLRTNVYKADYLHKPLTQPMIITNVAQVSDALFKRICKDFEEVSRGLGGRYSLPSLSYQEQRQQSVDIIEAIVQGFRNSLRKKKAMVAVAKASRPSGPRIKQFHTQGVNLGEAAASATCWWMKN